jgi:hypothetical protein
MMTSLKFYVVAIFLGAFYLLGFFMLPPLAYALNGSPFSLAPLILHDVFYQPVLQMSGPDRLVLRVWLKNADS